DRREVLVGTVPVLPERRLVPPGAVLATTTDVGNHQHAAPLQPDASDRAVIGGRQRELEAAISTQQRRVAARVLEVPWSDLEVGDAGAVLRRGEVLLHREGGLVEERRRRLDRLQRVAAN